MKDFWIELGWLVCIMKYKNKQPKKNCNFFGNKCCFFTGVSPGQFALAHFLVSLVVNLLQVIVTLVFTIAVFQVRKIILNEKNIL